MNVEEKENNVEEKENKMEEERKESIMVVEEKEVEEVKNAPR
jgi:hypothetical protein